MSVDKMSVSLALPLSTAVRDAANQAGESLSGWIADAAAMKLRTLALNEFLEHWEYENGAITDAELRDATARLGLDGPADEGWTRFIQLNPPEWEHHELVATMTRIIENGHPILIPEQDASELVGMKDRGVRRSFERVRVCIDRAAE